MRARLNIIPFIAWNEFFSTLSIILRRKGNEELKDAMRNCDEIAFFFFIEENDEIIESRSFVSYSKCFASFSSRLYFH